MNNIIKYILLTSLGIVITSCGAFLQQNGIKNYVHKKNIKTKEYNDYQYDFEYLTQILEIGFPNIDSVFPEKERVKLKQKIINSLANKNLQYKDFLLQSKKYLSQFNNEHTAMLITFIPNKILVIYNLIGVLIR